MYVVCKAQTANNITVESVRPNELSMQSLSTDIMSWGSKTMNKHVQLFYAY